MGLSVVASDMTRKGSCENRLFWLTLLVSCASCRTAHEIIALPFPSTPFPFHYPLISQSVIRRYVALVADTLRNKPQVSDFIGSFKHIE